MRRTLLVACFAPPAWRTGAGATDGVTAGRVVAGTAVATGGAPPARGTGDRAGPATVTSVTLTDPGCDTVTVLTGRPGKISHSVQAARMEDSAGAELYIIFAWENIKLSPSGISLLFRFCDEKHLL